MQRPPRSTPSPLLLWAQRPLASWLQDVVRHFWSSLLCGSATIGDCLSRLAHVAEVALDSRHPASVAERAAVRYDAVRSNHMSSLALTARGVEDIRANVKETSKNFDGYTADKMLGEEGNQPSKAWPAGSGGQMNANPNRFCLLHAVGACKHSASHDGKEHSCPFCGSSKKGCLITNHGGTVKRNLKQGSWEPHNEGERGRGDPQKVSLPWEKQLGA